MKEALLDIVVVSRNFKRGLQGLIPSPRTLPLINYFYLRRREKKKRMLKCICAFGDMSFGFCVKRCFCYRDEIFVKSLPRDIEKADGAPL